MMASNVEGEDSVLVTKPAAQHIEHGANAPSSGNRLEGARLGDAQRSELEGPVAFIERWKAKDVDDWLERVEPMLASWATGSLQHTVSTLQALHSLMIADSAGKDIRNLPKAKQRRAARAVLSLARRASKWASPTSDSACHVARAAYLLGHSLLRAPALATLVRGDRMYPTAAATLLAAVAADPVTYHSEHNLSQAASAQVYLQAAAPEFWRRLAEPGVLAHLKPRTGVNVLWARATLHQLGALPQPSALEWANLCAFLTPGGDSAHGRGARDVVAVMGAESVVTVLTAGAASGGLGFERSATTALRGALDRAIAKVPPRALAKAVWALGNLKWNLPEEIWDKAWARLAEDADVLDPTSLATLVEAFGMLRKEPSEDVRRAVRRRLKAMAMSMEPAALVQMLKGISSLRWEMPYGVPPPLVRAAGRVAARMAPSELVGTLLVLAHLNTNVPVDTRSALLRALDQIGASLTPYEVANALTALARLSWDVPQGALGALSAALGKNSDAAAVPPQAVAGTLTALAGIDAVARGDMRPHRRARHILGAALRCSAPALPVTELSSVAAALGVLRWDAGEDYLAPFDEAVRDAAAAMTLHDAADTLAGYAALARQPRVDALREVAAAIEEHLVALPPPPAAAAEVPAFGAPNMVPPATAADADSVDKAAPSVVSAPNEADAGLAADIVRALWSLAVLQSLGADAGVGAAASLIARLPHVRLDADPKQEPLLVRQAFYALVILEHSGLELPPDLFRTLRQRVRRVVRRSTRVERILRTPILDTAAVVAAEDIEGGAKFMSDSTVGYDTVIADAVIVMSDGTRVALFLDGPEGTVVDLDNRRIGPSGAAVARAAVLDAYGVLTVAVPVSGPGAMQPLGDVRGALRRRFAAVGVPLRAAAASAAATFGE